MPRGQDQYSSHRPVTIITAEIADPDAIKTSIATVAAAVSYTGVALNGADANPGPATPTPSHTDNVVTDVPQYPTATASSSAGSYVDGSEVVFTGTYGGAAKSRTATVVGTDGNATFVADGPLDTVSTVAVDAQADTDHGQADSDAGAQEAHGVLGGLRRDGGAHVLEGGKECMKHGIPSRLLKG